MVYTSPQVGNNYVSEVFYFLLKWFLNALETWYGLLDFLYTPFLDDEDLLYV